MKALNKAWFQTALRDRGKSQAALARHLDLDTASMSRLFSGQRRMQLDEAESIARFLSVSVLDVLKQAGLEIRETRISEAWECPRCGRMNAPRTEACVCG